MNKIGGLILGISNLKHLATGDIKDLDVRPCRTVLPDIANNNDLSRPLI